MRLSKQQKDYQEKIIAQYGLTGEFKPGIHLIEHLAFMIKHERTKGIFQLIGERVRRAWKAESAK